MPAAPPTFSMTNCCPSTSDIPAARMRAAVSVELPAAKGTTTVTGRDGQFWAHAAPVPTRVARAESMMRAGINMNRAPSVCIFVAFGTHHPCERLSRDIFDLVFRYCIHQWLNGPMLGLSQLQKTPEALPCRIRFAMRPPHPARRQSLCGTQIAL